MRSDILPRLRHSRKVSRMIVRTLPGRPRRSRELKATSNKTFL